MNWISEFQVDKPWHVWSQEDTDTRKKGKVEKLQLKAQVLDQRYDSV